MTEIEKIYQQAYENATRRTQREKEYLNGQITRLKNEISRIQVTYENIYQKESKKWAENAQAHGMALRVAREEINTLVCKLTALNVAHRAATTELKLLWEGD